MSDQLEATFRQHLFQLKNYLKPVAIVFAVVFIAAFYLSPELIEYVKGIASLKVIAIHPYEILMTRVKIGFYAGTIASMPMIALQFYRFFKPSMTVEERKAVRIYIPFLFVLTGVGAVTGFFFLTEMATGFLRELAVGTGVVNNWTISNVISYMLKLSLSAAIIFNIPIVVVGLVKANIIEINQLKQYRKQVLIGSVALAAIVSPPDFLSMIVLSAPTYGFYEIGVKAAAIL